mmetsp:Transcript_14140/g.47146  ORF Transcript_14140/g.47146 Transcript_14140/m.47146 type:complete len:765 (+) Transcript_14140:51-2345(+)
MPTESVTVAVRCRPFNQRELEQREANIVTIGGDGYVELEQPDDAPKRFNFDFSYDENSTQDTVYRDLGQPLLQQAFEGWNGTIFAYGQTGSGKTFTITGGAERYVDRGIIPRVIAYLFAKVAERPEQIYEVRVSYLEIYNEVGYDLLDEKQDTQSMEDLPKVSLLEDEDGKVHLRNLSAQLARSEEEALNLLFVGDTNRMISETPMNLASSRSHCIFTISIDARRPDSEVVRRSKLHLVDLAGSERVKKTGIEGKVLSEAKYINLSLHFLEQVIVALQEKQKFIPYRNSMMTSVLRDSLGGNCRTVMVATLAPEEEQLDETISSCRFAQRVAHISNRLEVNEEVDPKRLIARLKAQLRELKEELQVLRGEGYERSISALSGEERERCELLVREYLANVDPEPILAPGEMAKVQYCYRLLRERALAAPSEAGGGKGNGESSCINSGVREEEMETLRLQLQQRDHEINILVSMLNSNGSSGDCSQEALAAHRAAAGGDPAAVGRAMVSACAAGGATPVARHALIIPSPEVTAAKQKTAEDAVRARVATLGAEGTVEAELLIARNAAFEAFRRSYRKNQAIEENKKQLKEKYDAAKALGEAVNAVRSRINALKGQIDSVRRSRAAADLSGSGDDGGACEEESQLRAKVEAEKRSYKSGFARLKELKAEIEHLQLLLEQSRRRMQQDFEGWWVGQQPQTSEAPATPRAPGGASPHPLEQDAALANGDGGSSRGAGGGGPPLTGNAEVDAEIVAFYQAREGLAAQRTGG